MKTGIAASLFVLAISAAASAQDFGRRWADGIADRTMQDTDRALDPKPLDVRFGAGEICYFDNNIFLRERNARSDTVFVTFGQVGLSYAEESFDVDADLTANYNAFVHTDDVSDDEERGYLRARYQGAWLTAQVSEIFRRESEPIDATFADRAERIVSNTMPLLVVRFTDQFSVEGEANYQVVRFDKRRFEINDNDSARAWGSLVYDTGSGYDLVVQGGYLFIDYDDSRRPDADGFYVRGGLRGELLPDLHVEALGGYTKAESDDFPGTSANEDHSTADVDGFVRYKATEDLAVVGSYSRRIGFAATGAPFQVNDRAGASAEYRAMEDLKLTARAGYSHFKTTDGLVRSFYTASLEAAYTVIEHVVVDGGATWRSSDINAPSATDADFDNGIFWLGLGVVF